MRYGDSCASALIALVGIVALSAAWPLEFWTDFGPGPGFLPAALGAALAVMGTVVALAPLRTREAPRPSASSFRKPLIVTGLMAAYLVLLNVLGFVAATALFLFTVLRWVESRGVWQSAALALFITLALHLLFGVALDTALPAGVFAWKS
jgi:putative tricarboxylic transport membrane protein